MIRLTDILSEAGNDEGANKRFAEFLKKEYYDGAPESVTVTATAIAYNYMMDFDSRINPIFVKGIFKDYLNIDLPIRKTEGPYRGNQKPPYR